MASISVPAAILGAGALAAGSSVISGINSSNAATQAASTQATAANTATALQAGMFNKTQANLAPFIQAGATALPALQKLTGTDAGGDPLTAPLTARFNPSDLAATPGYQFSLTQGEKAVTNQFSSMGLGAGTSGGRAFPSGPEAAGITNYAEGLAGTTYNQQLANYLAQNQQTYNMLGGVTSTGETAAAGLGGLSVQSGAQIGNSLTSSAAATAGGIVGSANALSGALSGVSGGLSNSALLFALQQGGMFGNPYPPAATG